MSDKKGLRIVLVVDTTTESLRAAETAIELALANPGSRLFALNVVDKGAVNRLKRFTDKSLSEIEIEMEEDGWKYLYRLEEQAKDQGVATMILQTQGVVDHEVVKEAVRLKADLIIAAFPANISGQMRRLVLGTIEKILENSPCNFLVVK
jgi:nucleotide-binding universal stress UspA family protein